MTSIAENLISVRERIDRACQAAGREIGSVRLLAVSKTQTSAAVREAAIAGQRDFGENYVREGVVKALATADLPLVWHFIGPLQSNKTREVAEHFHWVHSIDREKIAQRLSDQRPDNLPPLEVCLQVNVSGEASKSGVSFEQLPALADAVARLPRLKLRGLMAIPEPSDDMDLMRRRFAAVREAMHSLNARGLALDTLSLGMSADLETAIIEGSTLVRVGTAIFGART